MKNLFAALCLVMLPGAAAADWSHEKGPNWAVARTTSDGVTIDLRCTRGQPNRVQMTLLGRRLPNVRGVMIWITLPSGGLARHPVDVESDGRALAGTWFTSELVMEQFRTGSRMEIDMPTRNGEAIAVVNMRGTGAARLAFLERCGF